MQRRDFFKNLAKLAQTAPKTKPIRPPYFGDEALFEQICTTCEAPCIGSCEEGILTLAEDATPVISFTDSGCTYCDECAKACPHEVLQLEHKSTIACRVVIDETLCMSYSNNICFTCKDPCLDNAIEFAGMFNPKIDDEKCTSCGFCIKYCPTEAIVVEAL